MLVLGKISETIISAGIWMTSGIYHVASIVFRLFLILSTGELVSQDSYKLIIENFYLVLGIIMLFILAFTLLRGMVNPDDSKQGTSTIKKVIVNLITSAIIMALLPTIFSFLYSFQNSFIRDYNVIGKFFGYGSQSSTRDDPGSLSNVEKVEIGANQIVNGVFTAFFNASLESEDCVNVTGNAKEMLVACQQNIDSTGERRFNAWKDETMREESKGHHSLSETISYVDETGSFGVYSAFANEADEGDIDFNFLLSLIGGILLIYVGVSYCFDMALRLVKLVFYQLIAPIPIFMRIAPEGKLSGMFNQWMKITFTCYFEVYTRIFIFYFVIYLCNAMMEADFLSNTVFEYGFFIGLLAKAFVLMGVITFMKQAPKLISEITGLDTGNMKLGIKDKLAAGGAFTAGAILGGGITSGVRNISNKYAANREKGQGRLRSALGSVGSGLAGTVSGGVRAGRAGLGAKSVGDMKSSASKGATGAISARDRRANYKAVHGGTIRGAMSGHVQDAMLGVREWAGVGVVSSAEADYYTSAAEALDKAHGQAESAYKGKSGHNKLKEIATTSEMEYQRVFREALMANEMTQEQWNSLSKEEQGAFIENNLSLKEARGKMLAAKSELKAHEATEMGKKMSMQMEAINALVNAKMKYNDISSQIFDDALYATIQGAGASNLVSKIKSNSVITMSDLAQIDMNSFESFLDKAGISAKNLAAEKRVAVSHDRALKQERKSDNK